jgi:MFS family permease
MLLLIVAVFALGFEGMNVLIKRLYVLRLGYGAAFLGTYNGVAAWSYMLAALPAGALGKRYGPRLVMRVGVLLTVLGMGLQVASGAVVPGLQQPVLFGAQLLTASGWASVYVNAIASLAHTTTPTTRGKAYALQSALLGLGTLLGNLLGGQLPGWFAALQGLDPLAPANYRWTMGVSLAVILCAAWPLTRISRLATDPTTARAGASSPLPLGMLATLAGVAVLSQGASVALASFGSAYLDSMRVSTGAIGAILAAGQLLGITVSLASPRVVRRLGARGAVLLGAVGLAVSVLPAVLVHRPAAAGLSIVAYMISWALWAPSMMSYEMDSVPQGWRSVMSGTHAMANGMSFGTFNLTAGRLVESAGYPAVFAIGGAISLVGTLWMAALWWRGRRSVGG